MAIMSEYTRDAWYDAGRWRSVEPYVTDVLLLFDQAETDPISEDECWAIRYGEQPPRTVSFQHYKRDDNGGWELYDWGDDHRITRTFKLRTQAMEPSGEES